MAENTNLVNYTPPPSLIPFLRSETFVSLQMGPIGSCKTTAGIIKIAYEAMKMAPCKDGIRRSRAIWIRNTRQMMVDSSIGDFLKWFPEGLAGDFLRTDLKYILRFGDVECEVLFRGLDDANDVRRLLAIQASFAILDEFREINPDIFEAVQGRLGRYPDKMLVPHRKEWGNDEKGNPIAGCVNDAGEPMKKLWGMSNPPDADSFWETYLSDPPDNASVFFQPGGLSPEADWIKYLPTNYYEDLMKGKAQNYIDVYINNEFGRSLSGQPVFTSFKKALHVAPDNNPPVYNPKLLLVIGLDPGMQSGAVICQQNLYGRVYVLDEITTQGMGAARFADDRLKPLLSNSYRGADVLIVCDPAADNRSQADEQTVIMVLRKRGFKVQPAYTNGLEARLSVVDGYLNRLVEGEGALCIAPKCKQLIKGMAGGYKYAINSKGVVKDVPDKVGDGAKHTHICDSLQYALLYFQRDGDRLARRKAALNTAPVWRPASNMGY